MKVTVASNRFYSTQICMPCIIEKVHHWKEYTVKLSEGGITIIPWTQCANAPFSSLTLDAWCYITISWRDNALLKSKMSNRVNFWSIKSVKEWLPNPFFSERHELGKVKITFNVQHFSCICSIQHVFWCDRKIRTMGLEDSLSVYWCPG